MNTFYKLRITTADEEDHPRDLSNVMVHIHRFINHFNIKTCTFGIETMNSRGQTCAQHIHFHFEYENDNGFANPHRNLKRWLTQLNIGLKGCAIWSFPAPSLCDDPVRLLRYPLKQNGIKHFYRNTDFEFNYEEQKALAISEYKDIVKRNMEHDRKSRTTSFYDSLEEHLNDPSMNLRECSQSDNFVGFVYELIVEYYVEQRKPTNPATIKGYTYTYLMANNYITPATYRALNFPDSNIPINHNGTRHTTQETKEENP